jgi:2-phospho-L-lactate/phosphoenolpyruvate guanylyltransferase
VRWILIVAKELDRAKTRLGAVLPPDERRVLAEAMFNDVLAAALASERAERVAVVTSDRGLLARAEAFGALPIDERFPRGLNVAVALGTRELAIHSADTICTVLSDIPLVTSNDIDAVLDAMPPTPSVVLVPSRDFSGTNIIARSPGDIIATRFGTMSLVKHLEDCRRTGVACQILRLQRPALDLDLMADLAEFVRAGSPTHTLNQLARLGIGPH